MSQTSETQETTAAQPKAWETPAVTELSCAMEVTAYAGVEDDDLH